MPPSLIFGTLSFIELRSIVFEGVSSARQLFHNLICSWVQCHDFLIYLMINFHYSQSISIVAHFLLLSRMYFKLASFYLSNSDAKPRNRNLLVLSELV